MQQLKDTLLECVNDELYQIVISNSREIEAIQKIKIRPVIIKDQLYFQMSRFEGTKVLHDNFSKEEAIDKILFYMEKLFQQMEIDTSTDKVTVLISKKGTCTIKKKKVAKTNLKSDGQNPSNCEINSMGLMHNRKKNYLLQEGTPVPFLIDLGVMTEAGKVIHAKYDKWKQINRFLEFVEDILPALPTDRSTRIIDFGCGKSYLTFAMYYFLKELKGYDIQMTGLDLKEDVISHCNKLAIKYGYKNLSFLKGDIADFEGESTVDMVVSLHACDTATDYALYKAIKWKAKVILSVPCCQHEVNAQISSESLQPILKYGLLKERIAALITDGLRANLLEEAGYDTQILEFIDMEHTPKNILIRAVKTEKIKNRKPSAGIEEITEFLSVKTTLQTLLGTKE